MNPFREDPVPIPNKAPLSYNVQVNTPAASMHVHYLIIFCADQA